ncbi:MAG: dihydrodipicolinate synthase family protein, partial [Bacteroidota bacterium]
MNLSLPSGTGIAVVTPFDIQGNPDPEGIASVVDHLVNGGVDFVVALGTTGETPT